MQSDYLDVKSSTRSESPVRRLRSDSHLDGGQLTIAPTHRIGQQEQEQGEVIPIPQIAPIKSCRICLEENQPLVSPCKCRGSVEFVHEQCIKLWIQKSDNHKIKNKICSVPCELFSKQKKCRKNGIAQACINQSRAVSIKLAVLIFLPVLCGFLTALCFSSFQPESTQSVLKVPIWLAIVSMAVSLILFFVFIWLLYAFILDYAIHKETKISLVLKQTHESPRKFDSSTLRLDTRRVAPQSFEVIQLQR